MCVNCTGGFKKRVKFLLKLFLYFQAVAENAFSGSLFNVMVADLPNYFYEGFLSVTVPSYCVVALMGNFCPCRFSYYSCEIEIFPNRERRVIIF